MAKLSAREKAAKKAGGKLNYKTGAVTKRFNPVSAVPKARSRYEMNPEDAPGQTTEQYEARIASGFDAKTVAAARNEAKLTSSPERQREAAKKKRSSAPKFNLSNNNGGGNPTLTMRGDGGDGVAGAVPTTIANSRANSRPANRGFKDWLNNAFDDGSAMDIASDFTMGNAGRFADVMGKSTPRANASNEMISLDPSQPSNIDPPTNTLDPAIDDREQAPGPVDSFGNPVRSGAGGDGLSGGGTVAATNGRGKSTSDGSGKSGSGKDSPYNAIAKQLQMNSKMQEKAFMDMLNSVDPTYQGYRDEFNSSLESALQDERQRLMTRQMGYGTADSEQRDQAEERLTAEFSKQRGDYLAKLATQQGNARSEIGLQRANSLGDSGLRAAQMQMEAYKYQQQMTQQEFENNMAERKLRQSGASRGYSQTDMRDWLEAQGQSSVDAGSPDYAREGIEQRASQMFGGRRADYRPFFPDMWENNYTKTPRYGKDELGRDIRID